MISLKISSRFQEKMGGYISLLAHNKRQSMPEHKQKRVQLLQQHLVEA